MDSPGRVCDRDRRREWHRRRDRCATATRAARGSRCSTCTTRPMPTCRFAAMSATSTQVVTSIANAVDQLGGLDIAIVNAGIGGMAPDPELEHRRMGSRHARQPARWLHDAARVRRAMVAHERPGAIVAVTSVSGFLTDRSMAHYSVSKAGLAALVRVAARELGPHGIRVNGVAPGTTDTPMFAATDRMAGYRERVASRSALGPGRERRRGRAGDRRALHARLGDRPDRRGRRWRLAGQPDRPDGFASREHRRGACSTSTG